DTEIRSIRGDDIAMIFQEPMTALNPLHTIDRQIAECLKNREKLNKTETQQAVINLLKKVKIITPEEKCKAYPHELSGGQRQRVMIAMAIANQPKLLIADEPTTALDVTVQAEVLDLLKSIQAETSMAMLFITHDLKIVKHYADRVAVMKDGAIIETGSTQEVFNSPSHAYTASLLRTDIHEKNPISDSADLLLNADNINVNFPVGSSFGLFKKQQLFHAVKNATFTL
ncbi:MAG: ATP-binding cassette domain-containing protein, partial [Psychromonas sp.]|nr:ATP-binding cassette domain-containing protein [Psychromonas sp.]